MVRTAASSSCTAVSTELQGSKVGDLLWRKADQDHESFGRLRGAEYRLESFLVDCAGLYPSHAQLAAELVLQCR